MLQIGDTVKVISKTLCNNEMKELITIDTICKVTEIGYEKDGTPYYGICPLNSNNYPYYYLESELEKGKLVWIPDKKEE